MSGNSIDDATLWHFLEKLGLTKEEFHPTFGPLEKFLKQEMAKEGESLKGFSTTFSVCSFVGVICDQH